MPFFILYPFYWHFENVQGAEIRYRLFSKRAKLGKNSRTSDFLFKKAEFQVAEPVVRQQVHRERPVVSANASSWREALKRYMLLRQCCAQVHRVHFEVFTPSLNTPMFSHNGAVFVDFLWTSVVLHVFLCDATRSPYQSVFIFFFDFFIFFWANLLALFAFCKYANAYLSMLISNERCISFLSMLWIL